MANAATDVELSVTATRKYWLEKDPRILHILIAMEKAENWVVDGNANAEKALAEFFKKAENNERTENIGKASDVLIYVMANLGVSRAMHMLSWLDSMAFGLGARVTQAARRKVETESIEYSNLLLERLSVLRRTRVLSRVFSTSRMMLVLRSLEEQDEY